MTAVEPRSSWELVAAAQAGDRDAFGQLWTRYQPAVHRYIASRVRDRGLAEDLTSDVFLKAWRGIGSITDQGREVQAWLTTIARNTLNDHYKSPGLRMVIVPVQPIQPWDHRRPTTPGPDVIIPDQHGRAAVAAHLEGYLRPLSPRQRAAVHMKYTEELSGEQMGARLGSTASAARRAHHRARDTIRERLAEHGITCSTDFVIAAHNPARTVVEFTDGTAA
jgi:RNA polymerase sigma-70 factor (ECF subfamily)